MRIKKSKIEEIINGDGEMIGSEDKPEVSSDLETQADKTTDYNAKVHGQNFKNDFLGRFGFYFYESEEGADQLLRDIAMIMYDKYLETLEYYYKNPDLIGADYKEHFADDVKKEDKIDGTDEKWANKIMDVVEPHLKKSINEGKVVEDKITDKKDKDKLVDKKKDNDIIDKKMKKVADLLDKLSDNEIDKLITVLEAKRKK